MSDYLKSLLSQTDSQGNLIVPQNPVVVSNILGVSLTAQKKDGVLYTIGGLEASEDFYYDVCVDIEGTNPAYGTPMKATFKVTALAIDLTASCCLPKGAQVIGFELISRSRGLAVQVHYALANQKRCTVLNLPPRQR